MEQEKSAAELRQSDKEDEAAAFGCASLYSDFKGLLKFTDKEILKMPKSFRRTFAVEGKVIFYRKRKRGIASCSYEARYE